MAVMRSPFLLGITLLTIACGGGAGSKGDAAPPTTGAAIYDRQCTLCHGGDGKLGINGAKDLTASSLTRDEMIQIVMNGKGLMMPYAHVLEPKEIEAVVDHVRTMKVNA
jgi:cytochrome c6